MKKVLSWCYAVGHAVIVLAFVQTYLFLSFPDGEFCNKPSVNFSFGEKSCRKFRLPINKPVKLLYLCVLWVQVQVRNVIVYSWRFSLLPQIVLIYCILILKTFLFNLLWPVFRAVSRVFHCFKDKKGSWYSLKKKLTFIYVRLRYIAQWRKKVDRKWWKKLESGGRKNTLYEQKINSGKKREMTRYTKMMTW